MECPKDGTEMTDLGMTNPWGDTDPVPTHYYKCSSCGQIDGVVE